MQRQRVDGTLSAGEADADAVAPLLRAAFHVHTNASRDASLAPQALVERCIDAGLDAVAVTDHNTIAGALAVRERAPFRVIVGEEIRTAENVEVIGLFLHTEIPYRTPLTDALREIRDQGGLIYAPHPFDPVRTRGWKEGRREILLAESDIIEVFNGRTLVPSANERARLAAEQLRKAPCAGADAHFAGEIGRTVVFLPPWETPAELLASLRSATFHCQRAGVWAQTRRLWTAWTR